MGSYRFSRCQIRHVKGAISTTYMCFKLFLMSFNGSYYKLGHFKSLDGRDLEFIFNFLLKLLKLFLNLRVHIALFLDRPTRVCNKISILSHRLTLLYLLVLSCRRASLRLARLLSNRSRRVLILISFGRNSLLKSRLIVNAFKII